MSNHDKDYLRIAVLRGSSSHAKKMKVGAIIVKEHRIISDGYNGTVSGFSNVCEGMVDGVWTTKPEVLHAEANAILKLARSSESALGATIYITKPPCIHCAKLIIQAGITRVVYASEHKRDGLDLLDSVGVSNQHLILSFP